MISDRLVVEKRTLEVPVVWGIPMQLESLRLNVKSQGTVALRAQATLFPEITGRVLDVSTSLAAGGLFRAGVQHTHWVGPTDYRLRVVQDEAETQGSSAQSMSLRCPGRAFEEKRGIGRGLRV